MSNECGQGGCSMNMTRSHEVYVQCNWQFTDLYKLQKSGAIFSADAIEDLSTDVRSGVMSVLWKSLSVTSKLLDAIWIDGYSCNSSTKIRQIINDTTRGFSPPLKWWRGAIPQWKYAWSTVRLASTAILIARKRRSFVVLFWHWISVV